MALFVCTQPMTTWNCAVWSFKPKPPPLTASSGHHLACRVNKCTPPPLVSSFKIKACGLPVGGNDETTGIDFASVFRDHESVLTGELEKQYLDYIAKLEFEPFHDHVRMFPRKRSEAEKKAIFDRYVELYDRRYVTQELKDKRYGYFISTLDWIDEHNAKNPNFTYGIALTDDLIPCDQQPPQSYTSLSFPPGEPAKSEYSRPGCHWDVLIRDLDYEEFCNSRRSKI